ncbi:hypothetical protein [Flavobacterium pectinovorum]|uniref:Minor curlin subunit n=1 Tax=Flavobacterium pectinovorum TaxID=29533 RepID=A0A502EVJ8_9FLAO|nr:hypothetical protein [Flavobacterium pectinovorum]TPG41763.1 hypothetical protein EAH81_09810 [Flavobacterium pectinovorum]
MKTRFLYIFLLMLFSVFVRGQQKDDTQGFKPYSSSVFDSKETALSIVSSMNKKSTDQLQLEQVQQFSQGVIIQQIGNYNAARAELDAEKINVSVFQKGDFNDLSLVKEAKTIDQNIIQQGKNNSISDYSFRTNLDIKTEMIQNGNDQKIQSYGSNSISKDMKITQTGNGASVIILNKLN